MLVLSVAPPESFRCGIIVELAIHIWGINVLCVQDMPFLFENKFIYLPTKETATPTRGY
jgi:hypothetical protein